MGKKERRDARREALSQERTQRTDSIRGLAEEAMRMARLVPPQDLGYFVVWVAASLRDWEHGSKCMTPAAVESARRRIAGAFEAWKKED